MSPPTSLNGKCMNNNDKTTASLINPKTISSVLIGASVVGIAATALATSYWYYESSSTYSAVGSGCSAAVFYRARKARTAAKNAARSALNATCDNRHYSDSECENMCEDDGFSDGWSGTWSTDVSYTKLAEDSSASCGHWVKYKATSECGCICYN